VATARRCPRSRCGTPSSLEPPNQRVQCETRDGTERSTHGHRGKQVADEGAVVEHVISPQRCAYQGAGATYPICFRISSTASLASFSVEPKCCRCSLMAGM